MIRPSVLAAAVALAAAAAAPARAQNPDFAACLSAIRAAALAQGVPASVADRAFAGLQPDQRVVDLDGRQPEFSLTFGQYVRNAISEQRVASGQAMLARHRALLEPIEREYGVPARYLVAFWGLETNYGSFMGDFAVVRSLATLACQTKRAAFFSNELVQALRILARNGMPQAQMRGSWAGAMGNTQFMPSTFMGWGVDRDGDGRIDLWNSLPDVFASSANFLRGVGWTSSLPSHLEVALPAGFPLDQADSAVEKPVRAWRAMGVRGADGRDLPDSAEPGSIALPAGHRGPAFLLLPNFKAAMNWNRSQLYALSVGHLAQRLAGGPDLIRQPPSDDQPLRRETVLDLQARLARLGLYDDDVDGLIGPKTRSGVRRFQQRAGLPPDGHPTPDLVDRLRAATR